MNRAELRFLIEAAFTADRPDFARVLSTTWLTTAPGDLAIRFYLARALAAEKQTGDALKELASIISVDYEHTAAYKLLASLAPRTTDAVWASASAHIISGSALLADVDAPDWMEPARLAVLAIEAGNFDDAREQIDAALRAESAHPLLSLILLKTHWRAQEIDLALPLARGFGDRWPQGVAFMLCMAEGLLRNGSAHQAVEVLHSASTLDAGADVVNRYWSDVHPYRNLWPQSPEITLPSAMPAEVAALLGLNRLSPGAAASIETQDEAEETVPEGKKSVKPEGPAPRTRAKRPDRPSIFGQRNKRGSAATAKSRLNSDFHATLNSQTVPATGEPNPIVYDPTPLPEKAQAKTATHGPVAEELQDIQNTLSSIASQIGSTRYQRKPAHVILFSPKLLEAKFGPQGAEGVLKLIGELGKVTAKFRRITVLLLAPEAPSAEFNLKAVNPGNAWDVKMMLHDLDRQLMAKGQAIGSLLIIGGDDLLPFHRLPNPTDDVDDDVPSDNPYGTSDDNYFIPEWPVGRLPSPCGHDPEPLNKMIRNTIAAHQSNGGAKWLGSFDGLGGIFGWLVTRFRKPALPASMGYSASVWKDASAEVFAPIGNSKQLHFSPPVDSNNAPSMARMRLSYFNLHGIEDGPNWFGQRDEGDGYGPLYPVAFEPKDTGKEPLPKVVFTEACYGANIINKTEPDAALSLRFLTDGVCAFVGSTKIAYGSVASPLIGADMLGRSFWEQLLTGVPVGEAFRRAKLQVAHTMNKRQSFLDGEDQKTLISFVLYGDPSLPILSSSAKTGPAKRSKDLPMVKTVAMEYETTDEDDMQPETVSEIKSMLSRYLPGSESAEISVSRPLSPIGAKSTTAPTHRVYTIAKTIRYATHTLPSFAKVTVNKAGKVVKVAVSR